MQWRRVIFLSHYLSDTDFSFNSFVRLACLKKSASIKMELSYDTGIV